MSGARVTNILLTLAFGVIAVQLAQVGASVASAVFGALFGASLLLCFLPSAGGHKR